MGNRSAVNAGPARSQSGFLPQALQYFFAFDRVSRAFRSVSVIFAIGASLCFIFLHLYLSQLSLYLADPSDRIGSRVLGVAAASVLVMLFWNSIVISMIVEIILNRKSPGSSFFGIRKWQWRLYAANLKLVLITLIYLCFFGAGCSLVRRIGTHGFAMVLFDVTLLVPLVWFLIRTWFFLLPVCLEAKEGEVLVKSFKLSAGHFWSAAAILLSIACLAIVLQEGAEFVLHLLHFIGPLKSGGTLAENLRQLRGNLGCIVIPTAIGYFFAALLTTVARIRSYEGAGRARISLFRANNKLFH
jgi:hypothetical protein